MTISKPAAPTGGIVMNVSTVVIAPDAALLRRPDLGPETLA